MKKLALSVILAATISCVGCSGTSSETAQASTSQTKEIKVETAEEALTLLKEGNARFLADETAVINVNTKTREELALGQHPYAVMISCSDSRVTPSHVFNAGLGELFEVRAAGNVLDDNALGSIEYGAEHLGIPLIVVMGHEKCGAVTAAYEAITKKQEVEGHIISLVEELKPSIEVTKASSIEDAAHQNVEDVIAEIEEDAIIAKLIEEGKVQVVGAYYALDGKVTFLE